MDTPPGLTNVSAVVAGSCYSIALRSDGTVAGWGDDFTSQLTPPANLTDARAIAAGLGHFVALRSNGTVRVWGDASLTNAPAGLNNIMAVAAGETHTLAVSSNGTVVAWGNYLATNVPGGLSGVVAVAGGGEHSMALRFDGSVVCWGRNLYGQTTVPAGLGGIVAIAAGSFHSLALRSDGVVFAWGQGQPGSAVGSGVIGIAGGRAHSLALLNDRTIAGWGDNYNGQLNTGGLSNVLSIATRYDNGLALIVDPPVITTHPQSRTNLAGTSATFTVVASGSAPFDFQWRKNSNVLAGATGASLTLTNVQLGDAGFYDVVVGNAMGTATSQAARLTVNAPAVITNQPAGQTVFGGSNVVVTFTVGASGSPPLSYQWRKDGTNISGAVGSSFSITGVFPANAGGYTVVVANSLAAVTSGVATLVVQMRPLITSQPQSQAAILGASVSFSVAASYADSYQWRKNAAAIANATNAAYSINSVQTNDAGSYSVVVMNAYAAVTSTVATLTVNAVPPSSTIVTNFGQALVWNGSAWVDVTPPSGLANATAISAGMFHNLALVNGSSVVGWGDNRFGQAASGLAGLTNVAAGGRHSFALTTAGGRVFAWGANDFGQTNVPSGLSNVLAIAAGGNHSLALRADGTVAGWGNSDAGQTSPLSPLDRFTAIAAGGLHSLGRRTDGTVAAWGDNTYGQSFVPPLLSAPSASVVAIAAGGSHSMALRSNGTVVVWGASQFGQTAVPPNLSNVIAIAAGTNHCLALRQDGTVVAWGQSNSGQTNIPANLFGVIAIAAGGDRSLLLLRKQVALLPPQPRPGGGLTLWLANNDGSPVDASRLEVRAGTNLAQSVSAWTRYTNFVSTTNNLLRWDDTNAGGLPWRFYRVGQGP